MGMSFRATDLVQAHILLEDERLILTDLAVGAIETDGTAAPVCISDRHTSSSVETRSSTARMLSTIVDVDACHSVTNETDHTLINRQLNANIRRRKTAKVG